MSIGGSSSDRPTVSVVMAVYNGAVLIRETIDSLIAQTMPDWELVVVDDCSADDTVAVIRGIADRRIRLIVSDRNEGPVHARNRALAEARGRYIAGLDHDDLCRAGRFATQVAYLDAHPETVLVGAAADLIEHGKRRPPPLPLRTSPALIRFLMDLANPLVWSSVMIRGDAARALDPFTRPEMQYAEDFDLYHRLAALGTVARIDAPLVAYRSHAGGVSRINVDRMTDRAAAVLELAHRPLFGSRAPRTAALSTRHFGGREPVADVATLAELADMLDRLLEAFAGAGSLGPADAALLKEESSRLWWRLVRTSIHAGKLTRREALSVRPKSGFVSGVPRGQRLRLAGMIGRARLLDPRRRAGASSPR